jgi:replicative DNA helicase
MINSMTTTVNFSDYFSIIVGAYKSREIIGLSSNLDAHCRGGYQPIIVERIKRQIENIHSSYTESFIYSFSDDVGSILDDIEERKNMWQNGTPFSTSLINLDKGTGGISKQTLTVVGAKPSCGKSSLLFQMGYGLAKKKFKILHFSTEMNEKDCRNRVVCSELGLDYFKIIRRGIITDEEKRSIREFIDKNQELEYNIIFQPGLKTNEIVAETEKQRPDFLFIDFLQDMSWGENVNREMGEACVTFKQLGEKLSMGVIVASQFNRKGEVDGREMPQLSDLRDSGGIEITADLVLLIQRTTIKPSENYKSIIHIAKQRNGPKMAIPVLYLGSSMRFAEREWADEDEQDR